MGKREGLTFETKAHFLSSQELLAALYIFTKKKENIDCQIKCGIHARISLIIIVFSLLLIIVLGMFVQQLSN